MKKKTWDLYAPIYMRAMKADQTFNIPHLF